MKPTMHPSALIVAAATRIAGRAIGKNERDPIPYGKNMTVPGALMTCLDQLELVTEMLETLDPVTASAIEMRATAVSMTIFDFVTVTIANAVLKTATPWQTKPIA